MKFVVLDVETANADMASICSIGAATYENRALVAEWYSLINPGDHFSPANVAIHGIDEAAVLGAPTFGEASPMLAAILQGAVVVTHTHFDRVAIHQAATRWHVAPPACRWMDSARVARRTWKDCARSGYGLRDLCKRIGYTFQHHNALEDAKAAGQIMLAAMRDSGLDLDAIAARDTQPIGGASGGKIERGGNPDGPLFGEVLVFTGALDIPRREAADLAAALGCEVASGVTKKTTLLVVGDTDVGRLAGHDKSSKHRKAEDLVAAGFSIKIVRETDFRQLAALA